MQAVANTDWLDYVRDPAWLPHAYDARRDTLVFAYLPRETQRRAVFLDRRFVAPSLQSPAAPLADLPPTAIRAAAGPMHFVFHTAFCCSTLLARALDIPGVAMGVKEPAVLVSFAQHWSHARQTPGALSAFGATLDLLSRPLAPGETQVVKPSNVSTHLIPEMLHLRPDAKAVVLYSRLETFLRAIARRGANGRAFARQVFQGFSASIPLDPVFSADELLVQTDMQLAAQVWLMQMAFLGSIARRHPDRVRVINSDAFLVEPARALLSLAAHFNLRLSADDCAAISAGQVFREHAKDHARPFDTAAHHAQDDNMSATLTEEVAITRRWAVALAEKCGVPLELPSTLLS